MISIRVGIMGTSLLSIMLQSGVALDPSFFEFFLYSLYFCFPALGYSWLAKLNLV